MNEGESPKKEKATDMALALYLIGHIEKPCEYEEGKNIRDFYIREAKRVLPTFQNQEARALLEKFIQKYAI